MKSNKMTKADLIGNLQDKLPFLSTDIHLILDAFFEEIKEALKNDRIIELRGFGTFEVRERKGRVQARNPKTGEIVSVVPHGVAIFRPGKELKDSVWNLNNDSNK